MIYSKLIGTGSALPARCVSNQTLVEELAARGIESSSAWIEERTGIRQRYLADPSTTSSQLGLQAARQALEMAGLNPNDLDLIIVATSTPDVIFPSTACLIQRELGCRGAAFDVQAVCAGFVYAMSTADAMIRTGMAKHALVVGAEVFSRIIDWGERRAGAPRTEWRSARLRQWSTVPPTAPDSRYHPGRSCDPTPVSAWIVVMGTVVIEVTRYAAGELGGMRVGKSFRDSVGHPDRMRT